MKKTIQQLCVEHGADKTPEVAHSYAPKYDELFKDLKNIKTVVEVGVGYPEMMDRYVKDYKIGASLYVWRDYFPLAKIYGIDNHHKARVYNEDRIKTFFMDATEEAHVSKIIEKTGEIDIFIDDGSHKSQDQMRTAQLFLPHMRRGGLYFIEDVRSSASIERLFSYRELEVFDWTTKEKNDDRLILIRC